MALDQQELDALCDQLFYPKEEKPLVMSDEARRLLSGTMLLACVFWLLVARVVWALLW